MSSTDNKKFLDNDGLLSYHKKLKEALKDSYATLEEFRSYAHYRDIKINQTSNDKIKDIIKSVFELGDTDNIILARDGNSKVVTFNQLVKNGNFINQGNWAGSNGTISVNENVLTYTVTSPQRTNANRIQNANLNNRFTLISGHKYLVMITARSTAAYGTISIANYSGTLGKTGLGHVIVKPLSSTFSTYGVICNFSGTTSDTYDIRLGLFDPNGTGQVGDTYDIKNFQIFDLTLMFGEGNEPETVEEFREMFPNDYYEYNEGTVEFLNGGNKYECTLMNAYDDYYVVYINDFDHKYLSNPYSLSNLPTNVEDYEYTETELTTNENIANTYATKTEVGTLLNTISDTYAKKEDTSNKIILSEDLGNIEDVGTDAEGSGMWNLVGLTTEDVLKYDTIIFNYLYYYKSYDEDNTYIAHPYDEHCFYKLQFGHSDCDILDIRSDYAALTDVYGNIIDETYATKEELSEEIANLAPVVESHDAHLAALTKGETDITWVLKARKAENDINGNSIVDTYATKADSYTKTQVNGYLNTLSTGKANVTHSHDSEDIAYTNAASQDLETLTATLDDIYDKIGSMEPGTVDGVFKNGRTFYNVCSYNAGYANSQPQFSDEIVIKTRIPFGSYSVPVIKIRGYEYYVKGNDNGNGTINIDIAGYAYNNRFHYTNLSNWPVSIYTSSYSNDGVNYLAISLKINAFGAKYCQNTRFIVDFSDQPMSWTQNDYSKGWEIIGRAYSSDNTDENTIIPQDNIKQCGEKPLRIYESDIGWGGKHIKNGASPIDAALIPWFGANRFAFMPAAALTCEYSTDGGTTWLSYDITDTKKVEIVSKYSKTGGLVIGNNTTGTATGSNTKMRIRITQSKANLYSLLNKLAILISTSGSTGSTVTVSAAKNSDLTAWEVFANKVSIDGWSGWNIINLNGLNGLEGITFGGGTDKYGIIELLFECTGHGSTSYQGLTFYNLFAFGVKAWSVPSNMANHGHLYDWLPDKTMIAPYSIMPNSDGAGNLGSGSRRWNYIVGKHITTSEIGSADTSAGISWTGDLKPSANNAYNLGSSSYSWNEIRAKTIYENGTKLSDTYATKDFVTSNNAYDGRGNIITDTYLTKDEFNERTHYRDINVTQTHHDYTCDVIKAVFELGDLDNIILVRNGTTRYECVLMNAWSDYYFVEVRNYNYKYLSDPRQLSNLPESVSDYTYSTTELLDSNIASETYATKTELNDLNTTATQNKNNIEGVIGGSIAAFKSSFSNVATKDGNGNVIVDTYATKTELSNVDQDVYDLRNTVQDVDIALGKKADVTHYHSSEDITYANAASQDLECLTDTLDDIYNNITDTANKIDNVIEIKNVSEDNLFDPTSSEIEDGGFYVSGSWYTSARHFISHPIKVKSGETIHIDGVSGATRIYLWSYNSNIFLEYNYVTPIDNRITLTIRTDSEFRDSDDYYTFRFYALLTEKETVTVMYDSAVVIKEYHIKDSVKINKAETANNATLVNGYHPFKDASISGSTLTFTRTDETTTDITLPTSSSSGSGWEVIVDGNTLSSGASINISNALINYQELKIVFSMDSEEDTYGEIKFLNKNSGELYSINLGYIYYPTGIIDIFKYGSTMYSIKTSWSSSDGGSFNGNIYHINSSSFTYISTEDLNGSCSTRIYIYGRN